MISERVLEHLTVTAEVCGANLSTAAVEIMLHDLARYPEHDVLAALDDCRRTLAGRFTLAAIVERIQKRDGRPGAEEAWAMLPKSESESVVWSDEMRHAWAVAEPLIEEGDMIAARMTFREAYAARVAENRAAGIPAHWEVSYGHDQQGREKAVQRAVTAGYISKDQATRFLPHSADAGAVGALLIGNSAPIVDAQTDPEGREVAMQNIERLKSMLAGKELVKTPRK